MQRFVSKVSDEQVSLKSKAQNSGSTRQMNCPKGIHHTTVTEITRSEPKQSVIQKQISPMCLCLTSVELCTDPTVTAPCDVLISLQSGGKRQTKYCKILITTNQRFIFYI